MIVSPIGFSHFLLKVPEPKNGTTTRAMLVTILHRLEGTPAVSAGNPFKDVKSNQWYTDAVLWANENGIACGYGNGVFGPMDTLTREQFAAMLQRYNQCWNRLKCMRSHPRESQNDNPSKASGRNGITQ